MEKLTFTIEPNSVCYLLSNKHYKDTYLFNVIFGFYCTSRFTLDITHNVFILKYLTLYHGIFICIYCLFFEILLNNSIIILYTVYNSYCVCNNESIGTYMVYYTYKILCLVNPILLNLYKLFICCCPFTSIWYLYDYGV